MAEAQAAEQVLWCPPWGGEQVSLQGNGEPNNVGASTHLPVWASMPGRWALQSCSIPALLPHLLNKARHPPCPQGGRKVRGEMQVLML